MSSLISYVNSSSNSGSIFILGSLSCNKPAGTVENDVMIALVLGVSGSTAETVNSIPSGWSTLYSNRIYYKVATGSEPSSYTWGWVAGNNAGIIIGTFRGVNTSDPIGDYDYTSDSSQDGSIVAPSIDIETTGNYLLNHNTVRSTFSPDPITPPTGSPTFTEYKEADTTSMVVEASYAETTTSGATGSKTATYSYGFGSGYEEGFLIELKQRSPAQFDHSTSDAFGMSDSIVASGTQTFNKTVADSFTMGDSDLGIGGTVSGTCSDNLTVSDSFSRVYGGTISGSGSGGNEYLTSDNFNDNSFDTGIWTTNDQDDSGSVSTLSEQNQRLELSQSTGTIQYNGAYYSVYQDSVSGDFDVRVKVADAGISSGSGYWQEVMFILSDSVIGNQRYAIEYYDDNGSKIIDYYTGGWSTADDSFDGFPVWFRYTLSGTTLTIYYSYNGSTWNEVWSNSVSLSYVRYVHLYSIIATDDSNNVSGYAYWDDFVNYGGDPTYTYEMSLTDSYTISDLSAGTVIVSGTCVEWGEETPYSWYVAEPWSEWMRVDESPPATISGTDWGYLNTYNGIHLGPVYDTTIASGTWSFTLYTDQWQSGQGSGTVYIRGSMTTFSGTDLTPTWQEITTKVNNKAWRYVQLKVEHTL